MDFSERAKIAIIRNDFRKLSEILIQGPNIGSPVFADLAIFCCEKNNLLAFKLIIGFVNCDYNKIHANALLHGSSEIVDFFSTISTKPF